MIDIKNNKNVPIVIGILLIGVGFLIAALDSSSSEAVANEKAKATVSDSSEKSGSCCPVMEKAKSECDKDKKDCCGSGKDCCSEKKECDKTKECDKPCGDDKGGKNVVNNVGGDKPCGDDGKKNELACGKKGGDGDGKKLAA